MSIIAVCIGIFSVIVFAGAIVSSMIKYFKEDSFEKEPLIIGTAVLVFGLAISGTIAIGYPQYKIWQQEQEGAAELSRAEQNRQISIQEAKAKEESARSLANAEVIRAEGVAKANKIIGDSLQNNDAYIHYLWIEALKESHDQVIYIPTEAGIPVTESARFYVKQQQKKYNEGNVENK